MFKPVHGIRGTLKATLNTFSTGISLDDTSTLFIAKMLPNPGDYTYLMIRTGYSYEIVKTVSLTGSVLNVVRAQDGTVGQNFPIGATVEFVLSPSAINDIVIQQNVGQVTITGSGIVSVNQVAPNQFVISAPTVGITSTSSKILVGGVFPNFVISSPLLSDCC